MRKFNLLLLGVAAMVFAGCDAKQAASPTSSGGSSSEIEVLKKQIDKLETDLLLAKIRQERFDNAAFDPAEGKGYARVETSSGTFLVSLQDATRHLDGIRVKLHIGNIQAAQYSGFEIEASYGRRYPKYDPNRGLEELKKLDEEYRASKRRKTEKFTQTLKPGSWNVVTLFLPDIKPENFGHLSIEIKTDQVLLKVGQ